MDSTEPPVWEQEGTLVEARHQVRRRVDTQVSARGLVQALWLSHLDPQADLDAVAAAGDGAVVGSDMALWRWSPSELRQLSDRLRRQNGLLVFVEPTAGLGWRRAMQMTGRRYRRDVPAELRFAGFIVTTQVRLWHGTIGTYVRGEACHFESPSS